MSFVRSMPNASANSDSTLRSAGLIAPSVAASLAIHLAASYVEIVSTMLDLLFGNLRTSLLEYTLIYERLELRILEVVASELCFFIE